MVERRELYPGYQPSFGAEVFSGNLEAIIERKGLSQRAIAKKAEFDPSYISRVINQRASLSLNFACKVAEAIGTHPLELISSEEIDSWLVERRTILAKVELEEMVRVLSPSAKRQLVEIVKSLKRKKKAAPIGEKFHFLEALMTQQKWGLRSVIEELESAGHSVVE